MRINHNISALKANNQLRINNGRLDKSLERLSSGYKINRASDDAAGMAISQKMKTQIRGLEQASQNAADGISVIQTAEGALNEVDAMLQRMRELSVQAKNGTNTLEDREAIQEEINKLNEEILRISETTEFNTKALLNGDIDRKTYSDSIKVNIISMSDAVDTKKYKIETLTEAGKAVMGAGAQGAFTGPGGTVKADEAGTININGEDVVIKEGESREEVITKLRDVCSIVDVEMTAVKSDGVAPPAGPNMIPASLTDPDAQFVFTSKESGKDQKIAIHSNNAKLSNALGIQGITGTNNVVSGTDANVRLIGGFTNTSTVTTKGNVVTISDKDGFEIKMEILPGAKGISTEMGRPNPDPDPNDPTLAVPVFGTATITVLEAGPMNLQIGANEGQTVEVRIPKVNPKTLGTDNVNVCTEAGAGEAITKMDEAIVMVSAVRAKLGAYQNRLDHAISNLDVSSVNLTEALSRIEDTDMAGEMATYTQMQVLGQASTSMLAQANERPQTILSLLQG